MGFGIWGWDLGFGIWDGIWDWDGNGIWDLGWDGMGWDLALMGFGISPFPTIWAASIYITVYVTRKFIIHRKKNWYEKIYCDCNYSSMHAAILCTKHTRSIAANSFFLRRKYTPGWIPRLRRDSWQREDRIARSADVRGIPPRRAPRPRECPARRAPLLEIFGRLCIAG